MPKAFKAFLVLLWAIFVMACETPSEKDPDDAAETDTQEDECDQLANGTWQEDPGVIKLDGHTELTGASRTVYGYAICSGAGFLCITDYEARNNLGNIDCWDHAPTTNESPTLTYVGDIAEGRIGIKCRIAENLAGVPYLITSAQYATNSDGQPNAGRMYVLPLEGQSGNQSVEANTIITITGVGENAYADIEYVPQPVVGGFSTEFCLGNTHPDGSLGGLYCLDETSFWALPGIELKITDLLAMNAEFVGHTDIDANSDGTTEWFPFYAAPLGYGRRGMTDPRYDIPGLPDVGIAVAIKGQEGVTLTGAEANAQFGHSLVELSFEGGSAIATASIVSDALMLGNADAAYNGQVIGFVLGPRHRQIWEAGVDEFTSTYFGYAMQTFEVCGTRYVAVGAPIASKRLDSEAVGAVHLYTEDQLLEAAAAQLQDLEDIENASPIPLVSVYGPANAHFGSTIEVVDGQSPLSTTFWVGDKDASRAYGFTLSSLLK